MQGARLAAVAAEVGVQRGVAAGMTWQVAVVVLQNSWGHTRPAAHMTPGVRLLLPHNPDE
jgi:hypothetical protein